MIRARQLPRQPWRPHSYFRVRRGQACEVTFEISDNERNTPVDWSSKLPRFRVYSQHADRDVVVEVTDPGRCSFGPDGIWRLHLTADETDSMPPGGMCFTLEHGDRPGEYLLGVHGGISCCDENPTEAEGTHQSNPRRRR